MCGWFLIYCCGFRFVVLLFDGFVVNWFGFQILVGLRVVGLCCLGGFDCAGLVLSGVNSCGFDCVWLLVGCILGFVACCFVACGCLC